MTFEKPRSDVHFGVAGVLTCLSVLLGISYLVMGLAIPMVPPSPLILFVLALTAISILYSMGASIRTIGRGIWIGWALLLGNCFYAVVLAPIATIHVGLALEAMR
jgi:hypothetical protein